MSAAAQLHAAQARYEDVSALYESDEYTEDHASDDASDELMATPCAIGAALEALSDPAIGSDLPGRNRVNVDALCRPELDTMDMPSHQLLAVLMSASDDKSILRAVNTLRERVRAQMAEDIATRAAELFDERNPVTDDEEGQA